MTSLKHYDLNGKKLDSISLDKALLQAKANPQLVKDYIVAIRQNQRQWSANTKTRAEIQRTKRKPHPQKGQGRARQGAMSTPQYRGGGIVFGPRPKKDQFVRINKKERRLAIRSLLTDKILEDSVVFLKDPAQKKPCTKEVAKFMKAADLVSKRVLVIGLSHQEKAKLEKQKVFCKSMKNLPKKEFICLPQLNGYDLIASQKIVVMDSALKEFCRVLEQGKTHEKK